MTEPRGNWVEEEDGTWSLYDAHGNQLAWVSDESYVENHVKWCAYPEFRFGSGISYATRQDAMIAVERDILEDAQRNYNALMNRVLAIGATLEEVQE